MVSERDVCKRILSQEPWRWWVDPWTYYVEVTKHGDFWGNFGSFAEAADAVLTQNESDRAEMGETNA